MSISVKPTLWPAAVFIVVEIVLVAETVSVILLDEVDPRNPGAAPIAILLSVALLANLGLVCGVAAAIAADSARRLRRAEASALIDSFTAVGSPLAGMESAGFASPACGAIPRRGPAWHTDSEDLASGLAASAMPASG